MKNNTNIINLLGIEKLPLEEKKLIVSEATDLLDMRVLNKILNQINEGDKIDEMINLLDGKNTQGIAEFFKKENVDIIKIIEEEVKNLKEELESDIKV